MRYRTVICGLLVVVPLIAGCGLFSDGQGLSSTPGTAPTEPMTVVSTSEPELTEQSAVLSVQESTALSTPPAQTTASYNSASLSNDYFDYGVPTLEERILRSDAVVRARIRSKVATHRWITLPFEGGVPSYLSYVEFTFDVLEVLRGTVGDTVIVELEAVGRFGDYHEEQDGYSDSAAEAERRATEWVDDEYDSQWESRDAILFLVEIATTPDSTRVDTKGRPSNVQYAFNGYGFLDGPAYHVNGHDYFSISSDKNQVWLPATITTLGATTFYLEEPSDTEGAASGVSDITLAALKSTIKTETDLIDTSIPGYRKCLVEKKLKERMEDYGETSSGSFDIGSGLPAGTVMYERVRVEPGYLQYHLYGTDGNLFEVGLVDSDTNPQNGFAKPLKTARPLPRGVYNFEEARQTASMIPCGYIPPDRRQWTINVAAPDGTLHELFFDPVTVGTTVAADNTNGVLKPPTFTDANGASVTIQRIEWSSDTVKVKVSPHTRLAGHRLDFIELDGAVSLSLVVDEATVDSANDTLSWSVATQPWHNGDKLMLRIREAR